MVDLRSSQFKPFILLQFVYGGSIILRGLKTIFYKLSTGFGQFHIMFALSVKIVQSYFLQCFLRFPLERGFSHDHKIEDHSKCPDIAGVIIGVLSHFGSYIISRTNKWFGPWVNTLPFVD
jgi:hypothetical protein